jgi:hypothetical protein
MTYCMNPICKRTRIFLSLHLKHVCNLLRNCNSVCWQNYEKDNLTFDPLPWLNIYHSILVHFNAMIIRRICSTQWKTHTTWDTVEKSLELRYSGEIVRIRIQCIIMHKNRKAVQKVYELKCKADSVGIEMLGINRIKWDVGQAGDGYKGKSVWIRIMDKSYEVRCRAGKGWIPGRERMNQKRR